MKNWLHALIFFLCTSVLYADDMACKPIAIYVSWHEDPTTTMDIKWISPLEDTETCVHYKKENDTSWASSEGTITAFPYGEPYALHTALLKNLSPNTTYSFHIKNRPFDHLFTTMPANLFKPLFFIIGGDINLSRARILQETTACAALLNPAFIAIGGDFACPGMKGEGIEDPQKWIAFLKVWYEAARCKNRLIPLLTVIGNHDIQGSYGQPLSKAPYFSLLFLGEQKKSYSLLRFGQYASLYLLDSGHASPPGGEQAGWLEAELLRDKNVLHRIAIYHVSAYPPFRSYRNSYSAALRRAWAPLFEKFHVHLAFEHHDHAYKRTHPMVNEHVDQQHGVVYVGNGPWGVSPRTPKKASRTVYLQESLPLRGFCCVTLSMHERNVFALSVQGEVVDFFSQPVAASQEVSLCPFSSCASTPG